jgi:hypothetical protein
MAGWYSSPDDDLGDPPDDVARLPEAKTEKWSRWIRHDDEARPEDPDYLWLALVKIEHHRAIYRRLAEIVQGADLPASSFFGYLSTTYVDSQMVAIRRASGTDRRRQSITIRRVLEEIAEEIGRLDVSRGYAIEGRWDSAITVSQVEEEIAKLDENAEPVNDVVDQRFAHMDEREVAPLTFEAINQAIETIGAVFRKTEVFLTGASTPDLVPVFQDDWEAIFRKAWLPERQEQRGYH